MKKQKDQQDETRKGRKPIQRKNGDDVMSNVIGEYATLNLQTLVGKKRKIVSSEEALKDVVPVDWGQKC